MMIGDKQCNFVALYRSPSQKNLINESDFFSKNLEITVDKLVLNNRLIGCSHKRLTQNQKIVIPQIELTMRTI